MSTKRLSALSLSLTITVLLSACGGGGSSQSAKESVPDSKPIAPKPVDPEPTDPEPEVVPDQLDTDITPISEQLLANDTALPALPLNNKPLPVWKDEAFIEALQMGIYDYSPSKVNGFMAEKIDCNVDSDLYCPAIVKYQLDSTLNKISTASWAYMPIQKKWIALEDNSYFINLPDLHLSATDGLSGSYIEKIDFLADRVNQIKDTHLVYKYGDSEFNLSGIEESLANSSYYSSLTESFATHSAEAKIYKVYVELAKGEIFLQPEFGELGTYASLADFRDNHTTLESPVCVFEEFYVFNPTSLGVRSYRNNSDNMPETCELLEAETSIELSSEYEVYSEGVKIIGNNKAIYFDNFQTADEESSSLQYLPAIYRNENGMVSYGKALQEGYAFTSPQAYDKFDGPAFFYNKAAVVDWIKTRYNDPEALNLPAL